MDDSRTASDSDEGWECEDDMLEDVGALVLGSVGKGYTVNTCHDIRLHFAHHAADVEITVTVVGMEGSYKFRLTSRLDCQVVALRSRGETHLLLDRVFEMADRLAAAERL